MVERKKIIKALGIILLFLSVSTLLNFRIENILEPDSLYHIRHAWLYRTTGFFDSSFPWTQFSAVRTMGADLWYGFHILLVPLTYISDPALAVKMGGFVITFLVLISCYWAFRNLGIKFPEMWSIFFLLSSPAIMQRMTFTRPHPLSLALMALIFSFFFSGSAAMIFVCSFILSWIHSAVFWLPLIIGSFVAVFNKLGKQKLEPSKFVALVAGIAAGLFARPNPIANLKLVYIQIVDLYLSKGYELAQTIGGELRPPTWESTYSQKWLFVLLAASLIYLGKYFYKKYSLDENGRAILLSSGALIVFSALMYATAKRAIDQLGIFAVIFIGSVFTLLPTFRKSRFVVNFFIIFALSVSVYNLINPNFGPAHSPTKFKASALWLKENTNQGDVVFHLNWSHFPFLFFWNQHNYYIYGMDPVFLLKYDEKLYWELYNMLVNENDKKRYWNFLDVAGDVRGLTCPNDPKQCGPENIKKIPEVLRDDFKASYVFVINKTSLSNYLEKDNKNFQKVYEDKIDNASIYKILEK